MFKKAIYVNLLSAPYFTVAIALLTASCGLRSRPHESDNSLDSFALWSENGSNSDGWSSSGGDLHSAATNPWWVSNTKEVSYCVVADEATSSVNGQRVSSIAAEVIDYWKEDFSAFLKFYNPERESQVVATQKFNLIPSCNGTEDLKIQVGEGTLSELQRRYFGERLNSIAGVAVRTQYDEVNLVGKGFIYLTGDKTRENKPWANDRVLFRTLSHEMGHVFGLAHRDGTIMDQSGPSTWMEWKNTEYSKNHCPKQPPMFSSFFPEFYSCSILIDIGFFNGVKDDKGCLRLNWHDPTDLRSPIDVRVQSFWSSSPEKLVGQIRPNSLGGGMMQQGGGGGGSIFLPSIQTVFPEFNNTSKRLPGMHYPLGFAVIKGFAFKPLEGAERPLDKFEWNSDSLRILAKDAGIIDGEIINSKKIAGDFSPQDCQ